MDWLHVCNVILLAQTFAGFFSNLGVWRLFSFPLIGSLFLARRMLIGWLQVTWWGRGIPPFQGKLKLRSSRLPAPAAPHTAGQVPFLWTPTIFFIWSHHSIYHIALYQKLLSLSSLNMATSRIRTMCSLKVLVLFQDENICISLVGIL